MKKFIGIDLGTKTVGISRSDVLGFIHPVDNVRFEYGNYREARHKVYEVCDRYMIYDLVVGFPLQIDRTEGERCESVKRFVHDIRIDHPEYRIHLFDESYSTIEAHDRLRESGYKEEKIKSIIDMYSAVVILEDFLRNYKGEKSE